jgi:hypothetical protein
MTAFAPPLPDPSPQSAEELESWLDAVAPISDAVPESAEEWTADIDAMLARGHAFSRLLWRDFVRDFLTLTVADRLKLLRTLTRANWVSMYRALVVGAQPAVVR